MDLFCAYVVMTMKRTTTTTDDNTQGVEVRSSTKEELEGRGWGWSDADFVLNEYSFRDALLPQTMAIIPRNTISRSCHVKAEYSLPSSVVSCALLSCIAHR